MEGIHNTKLSLKLCMEADITANLWGHRGYGKSSIVKQLAEDQGIGFIDMRLSQMEASDVRGLPARDVESGRTVYLPPADMPIGDMGCEEVNQMIEDEEDPRLKKSLKIKMQPRYERGILFLDEVNRAPDDVQQAVFQLVLDKRVGMYSLPPGWSVICAGNFMDGDYIVNGFSDAAFLDRFCHLVLTRGSTGVEDWIKYMSNQYPNEEPENAPLHGIIEFAASNEDNLYGKVEGNLGFSIQPSPRSWEMAMKVLVASERGNYSDSVVKNVLSGILGMEMTNAYMKYNCPVKARDIVKNGVARYTEKLDKLERGQKLGVMYGLISILKKTIDTKDSSNIALDFAEYMAKADTDRDIAISFIRALADNGGMEVNMITNRQLGDLIRQYQPNRVAKKTFITRLQEREDLHKLISKIGWGS